MKRCSQQRGGAFYVVKIYSHFIHYYFALNAIYTIFAHV